MAFLRPNDDAVDGGWLNDGGSNVNLYASLNETTAVDTSYIQSPANPVNDVCKIALSNPTGTLTEPFVLRYRYNNIGGATLTVRLMQGTTPIAAWPAETDVGWTTKERTLSNAQFITITDFTDLYVELKASAGDPTLVLDLDFSAAVWLDNRVTFSRTTPATFVNSTGLIAQAVTNLMPRSADMNNYVTTTNDTGKWTRGNSGVTIGAAVAGPDGSMTGRTINVGTHATEAVFFQYFSGIITPGGTYTHSVWAKRSASGSANKFRMTTNSALGWNTGISQKFTLTDQWVRYTMTGAISTGPQAAVSICDRRQVDGSYDSDSDLDGNVDFWGPQLNQAPVAETYFPTNSGTNANYGPRFDYDPATLAARGLLMEEQRTNVILQSADLAHTSWTTFTTGGGSISRTANSGVAPDGTTTACLITMNRALTSEWAEVSQVISGLSGSSTASVWLKAFAAGDVGRKATVAWHNGTTFAASTQVLLTAGWTRYSVSASASGSDTLIIGNVPYPDGPDINGETKFYAWGGQAELGAFASSYIPTTSAGVARAADAARMTGTNFSSWYGATEGTFVLEFIPTVSGGHYFNANNGTDLERNILAAYSPGNLAIAAQQVSLGGALLMNENIGNRVLSANNKAAFVIKYGDCAACMNGGTVATDIFVEYPAVNRLDLANDWAGIAPASLWIKHLSYYNVRKTNSEIQALTT